MFLRNTRSCLFASSSFEQAFVRYSMSSSFLSTISFLTNCYDYHNHRGRVRGNSFYTQRSCSSQIALILWYSCYVTRIHLVRLVQSTNPLTRDQEKSGYGVNIYKIFSVNLCLLMRLPSSTNRLTRKSSKWVRIRCDGGCGKSGASSTDFDTGDSRSLRVRAGVEVRCYICLTQGRNKFCSGSKDCG